MAKNERIKEELGWLKVPFGVLIALEATLVAWLAQHFDSARPVLLIAGMIGAVALMTAIIAINRLAYKQLKRLE